MTAELSRVTFGPPVSTLEFDHAGDRALGRRGLRPPQPRVSVIVPAKGEAENILEILPYLSGFFEVIVVLSEDDRASAEAAVTALPSARVIHQTRKGKGNALACGMAAATGDIIVMLDADGSTDPAEIPGFVGALLAGADFAKGSRFIQGGGSTDITRLRRAGNWALNFIVNVLFGTRYTDLCYGYNAFWRHCVTEMDLPDPVSRRPQWGDGFEIETLINVRIATAGLKIAEVCSFEQDRIFGVSNLNVVRDGLRVLRTIGREYLDRRKIRGHATGRAVVSSIKGGLESAQIVAQADHALTV
ncbi:MAG: glycosyltransferase family 2 protein [Actinomycetes bacterium]